MASLALLGRTVLDLLAPADCAGCGAGGAQVCGGCRALLSGPAREVAPDPLPPGFPRTWAGAAYDGAVRELLLGWKEHGRTSVRAVLAPLLAEMVVAATTDPGSEIALVPVPSRRDSQQARGGDPLLELTRVVARRLRRAGSPAAVMRAIQIARAVRDQAGLTAAERAANLSHAFEVRPWAHNVLPGRAVVVVDDIVTTGATLVEAARALRTVGVQPLAVCVAATARRRIPVDPGRQED